jgi:hypothetical protein
MRKLFGVVASFVFGMALQQTIPGPSNKVLISTTTATVVKAGPGQLHTLTFGTVGASAVINVYDLPAASCTGTPAGTPLIITPPSTGMGTLLFDATYTQGICIQDTVAASSILAVTN